MRFSSRAACFFVTPGGLEAADFGAGRAPSKRDKEDFGAVDEEGGGRDESNELGASTSLSLSDSES